MKMPAKSVLDSPDLEAKLAAARSTPEYVSEREKLADERVVELESRLARVNEAARALLSVWGSPGGQLKPELALAFSRLRTALSDAPDDRVLVPRVPSLGLLVSIAMRLDHGFGIRRSVSETQEQHSNRQRMGLADARRTYDEIVGNGFYKPRLESEYIQELLPEHRAMLAASEPKP